MHEEFQRLKKHLHRFRLRKLFIFLLFLVPLIVYAIQKDSTFSHKETGVSIGLEYLIYLENNNYLLVPNALRQELQRKGIPLALGAYIVAHIGIDSDDSWTLKEKRIDSTAIGERVGWSLKKEKGRLNVDELVIDTTPRLLAVLLNLLIGIRTRDLRFVLADVVPLFAILLFVVYSIVSSFWNKALGKRVESFVSRGVDLPQQTSPWQLNEVQFERKKMGEELDLRHNDIFDRIFLHCFSFREYSMFSEEELKFLGEQFNLLETNLGGQPESGDALEEKLKRAAEELERVARDVQKVRNLSKEYQKKWSKEEDPEVARLLSEQLEKITEQLMRREGML